MCLEVALKSNTSVEDSESIPTVALITLGVPSAHTPTSSNIFSTLGDTYHKYKLARIYSGNLEPMRICIRENYKFHLEWFEETIRVAGLPQYFDSNVVRSNESMAIYAEDSKVANN